MSSTQLPPTAPGAVVTALFAEFHDIVDRLRSAAAGGTIVAAVGPGLVPLAAQLLRDLDLAGAVAVHTTGALHRSSELRSEGFVSTQQWLVKAQGMSKQDATAMMARTRDMTGDFTRTWDSWNDGAITGSAAREIAMGLTSVYRGQPAEVRAEMSQAESVLVELAKTVTIATLRNAIEQLRAVVDAEGMTQSAMDAYDDQSLSFAAVGSMAVLKGYLTHEAHALIATALDQIIDEWFRSGTLTPPDQPTDDETRDGRTRRRRAPHLAALALVELARRQVDNGLLGSRHEVRPHITLMVDADTLARGLPGELRIPGQSEPVLLPAESVRRILCDSEITDVITTTKPVTHQPATDLSVVGVSHPPQRPRPQWDSSGDDSHDDGVTGGTVPDREVHEDGVTGGSAELRPGRSELPPLPPIIEAALGDGVRTADDLKVWLRDMSLAVLYLGRRRRTATRSQRTALTVRDGHCQFPGCTVDPSRCEAHHVRYWELGGRTDLNNLVLLCAAHHHLVHEGRWTITADQRLDAGTRGYWLFAPPPRRRP